MGAKFGGTTREVELVQLLASPVHRYEGRPVDGPRPVEGSELRDAIELRAGLGVIGDRHFAHPAHRQASVTLQSVEALEHVAAELGVPVPGLTETRRNVLLRGIDVDALVGVTFALGNAKRAPENSVARSVMTPRHNALSTLIDTAY